MFRDAVKSDRDQRPQSRRFEANSAARPRGESAGSPQNFAVTDRPRGTRLTDPLGLEWRADASRIAATATLVCRSLARVYSELFRRSNRG